MRIKTAKELGSKTLLDVQVRDAGDIEYDVELSGALVELSYNTGVTVTVELGKELRLYENVTEDKYPDVYMLSVL